MIKILKEFDVERKKIYKETDINYLQENIVDAILDRNHPKKPEDYLRLKRNEEIKLFANFKIKFNSYI